MSIDSLQSNPWANPWATSTSSKAAGADRAQAIFTTSGSNSPASAQGGAGSSTSPSPANPLQSLASDIQALLIQAQNTGTQGSATGGTTGATTGQQSVATDLQTMLHDIQAAITGNTQTANSDPTSPTGETRHHHHHNIGGGEANGASDVASASTLQDTGSAVASVLPTGIAQAIQAYANGGASTAAAALTV